MDGNGGVFRVVVIYGSPRKGLSYAGAALALEAVKRELNRPNKVAVEVVEIDLQSQKLQHCLGCMQCFEVGEDRCPHALIIQPIAAAIKAADLLIMTSPVYALNVSGVLKNTLDHLAFFYHRPFAFNKRALVISATAGGAARSTTKYMRDTLKHWGFNIVGSIALVGMGKVEVTAAHKITINKAVARLNLTKGNQWMRQPTLKRLFFFNLWRALNTLDTALKTDAKHWREQGLTDLAYGPMSHKKISVPRQLIGNLFYKLFKRLF